MNTDIKLNENESFSLNELGNKLIEYIENRENVFTPINIVVPSLKIEQWFKTYWLKTDLLKPDKDKGILMNVNFASIDSTLLSFLDLPIKYKLLDKDLFKSFLIKCLLNSDVSVMPYIIKNYIYSNNNVDSIKLYDLASKLSQVFMKYEQDQEIILNEQTEEIAKWEKNLYDEVLEEANKKGYSTLSYIFSKNKNYNETNKKYYFFGFTSFTKLQESIIEKFPKSDNIVKLMLTKDDNYYKDFSLTAAPSMLREMEVVHSQICELLTDKRENNKYSDFLVLAPNISVYENIISRVFKQDNQNFPNIPYSINDRKKVQTNLSLGLKKFFEILNKKYYTRFDFFTIISNGDVQKARGITEENVICWCEAIVNMNVYRNGNNREDWDYAKKRVLLSKIVGSNDIDDNIVTLYDKSYMPYSNINLDDESIVKFVSVIDDLNNWIKELSSIEYINKENIEIIIHELSKWFAIKDANGFETNSYYRNIINILYSWINNEITDETIPLNTLFYLLMDASLVTKCKANNYFTKGITFSDFDVNSILSAKYVFFLNAGSNELPQLDVDSELDLSENKKKSDDIRDAFLMQYRNAEKKFFISYINRNLKTDEELYPSSFIKIINKKEIKVNEVPIDEKRSWSKLYTKKEFNNKEYYLGLFNNENLDKQGEEKNKQKEQENIKEENVEINNQKEEENKKVENKETNKNKLKIKNIQMIRVKDMSDFLEEPLKYKAKKLFGNSDSLSENIRDEFEPFKLNNLIEYNLINEICTDVLINKIDKDSITSNDYITIKEKFNLYKKIPDINEIINKIEFDKIIDECNELLKAINEKLIKFEVKKIEEVAFDDFILTCNKYVCIHEEDNNLGYMEIKPISTDSEKKYLFLYVFSLMHIASLPESTYHVTIYKENKREFDIEPTAAKKILNDIYELMNDYKKNEFFPIDNFGKIDEGKIKSVYKLAEDLYGRNSPWKYFDDEKLFDYDLLGYDGKDFESEIKELVNKYKEIVIYLNDSKKESEKNTNE